MNVTTGTDIQTTDLVTALNSSSVSTGTTAHDVTSSAIGVTDFTTNVIDSTTHIFDTYNVFIHPHWRQFPLVSNRWHYLIGVYITLVGITGIIGNSLVIWIFSREQSLRTPSNMYLINLAISDLTFSIVNGFPLLSISAFNTKWMFGQAACEFYGLIGGIFGLMSINTMTTIAIDRYYAIVKPLEIAKTMTRKRSFIMIVVVWFWSLVSAVPPIFGWGRYIPEGFQTSCTFDYLTRTNNNRTYILFLYLFGFAVPLLLIIVCYVLIIKAVNKHENEMKKTAKKLNAEMRSNQDKQRMEIKVAKIAMAILFLYLLSWTPYATVALIGQFGSSKFVTPFWSEIPVMFAKTSAIYNPIVYALSHPKFRAAIHKRLPWLCCCNDATPSSATQSGNFKDRNASKRSISSITGAISVTSEISNVSDSMYADMELRLRKLEEEKETTFSRRRKITKGKSRDQVDDIPTVQIIQDLTQALIEISSRERSSTQAVRPVYLPSNILQRKPAGENAADNSGESPVFVLDNTTLPQLASYLTQFSNINKNTDGGVSNPGLNLSPESPTEAVSSNARKLNNDPEPSSSGLKQDEERL